MNDAPLPHASHVPGALDGESLNLEDAVRLRHQATRDLGSSAGLPALLIYPLLVLTTAYASDIWQAQPGQVLACMAVSTALGLVRFGVGLHLKRAPLYALRRLHRVYFVLVILVAGVWAFYAGWAVICYGRSWSGLLAMLTTVGIVAGSTSTLTSDFRLMVAYLLVMLLPPTTAMALIPEDPARLTAAIVAFFALFMSFTGWRHAQRYTNLSRAMLELERARIQQEDLLQQEKHQGTLLAEQNLALTKARRAAEQASQSKTTFLATMSHEIRTPMNAIVGLTNLLLDSPLNEQQQNWLLALRNSSESLLVLISDILDLSKIEARQMKADLTVFALRDLLEELTHLMGPVAEMKGLKLRLEVDPNLPPGIQSDRMRLRQILLNLLGNAIKFSQEGTVQLRLQAADGNLTFSCWDEGIGISAEDFRRLFQPFSQGDTRATRVHGGTGLGLAISRELAHLLGGNLWVSSHGKAGGECPAGWQAPDLQKGSQFWLRLPLVEGHLAETSPTANPVLCGPLKILVAEDNRVNQMVIREILTKLGHQVHLVDSGQSALEALEREHFPVILMDLQMPILDGLEATREIRKRGGAQPWIVALTANAFVEDKERCLQAGMNDYLSKPVRLEELKQALSRVEGE